MSTTMLSRRHLLGLTAVGATALAVAACGGSSSGGSDASATQGPVDTATVSGEITFQTQGLKGTFDDFFNGLIKDFQDAHPGTTITWTDLPGADDTDATMVTQASNGTMADVINVASTTVLALSRGDFLLDIASAVPGIGDRFVPGVWDKLGLGVHGEHTALPWYFGPFVVTYNKDIFKAAGLDPATPPTTMEEYFDYASKITAAGKQAVYGNTSWYMLEQWRAYGAKVMNDDATEFVFADDPKVLAWLENMAKLYSDGGIPKDSVTGDLDMSKAFGAGDLAFGTPNASFIRNVAQNSPQTYAVTGVGREPLADGVKPLCSAQYIAVSKKSKNTALAVAFADWMTQAEQGKAWAQYGIDTSTATVFPITTDALNELAQSAAEGDSSGDAFTQARIIAAEEATEAEAYMPDFYVTGAVGQALADNVDLAIAGDQSAQDALSAAQKKMNMLLEKLLKNG